MTNDHVALQLMACTLQAYNYDELRKIYEDHQLHVTPITSNAKEWLAEQVAKGDVPRRYYRSDRMSLNLARWADVMRNVTPTRLNALLAYCKSQEKEVPPFMQYLLRSFSCFTHDEPFEEDLKRVAWPILMAKQPEIQTIIEGMARQADYVPFMQAMPGNMLTPIFYHVYVSQWIALQPAKDMELVRLLFFDNPLLDESRRHQHRDAYLYNVEFLQTGKLAELQAQMAPDSEYHHKLAALQKLHEGQPDEALALLAAVLKSTDKNIFDEPLTNFAYALALGQSKLPKARKIAEKLMRSREVTNTDYCYAMQLVLQHYVIGNAADFFARNPLTNCHDTMCWRLATLFLHHFQILDKEPGAITEAGMLVANSGYDYLRLIWSDDYDVLQPLAGQLQRQTGLSNTLLPKVKRMEQWQRVMEQLLKLHKPATPATKTEAPITLEMERVAYVVNLRNRNVQPKLQKSKDGGLTWSKGRNIALKSFENSRSSYMTAQDRQVARMVKTYSYGWYGQVGYELAGIGVIAALAGCQCVFDEFTDQRIDIVEEPLQLTVTPTPNGYAMRSNASLDRLDASGICLTQEGDKQVTIVRVNSKQRKTLELLHDVDTFPLASKKPLTQLLQNLSGTFTVMSPLLKNATDLKHVEASALIAVQIAPAAETARVLAGSGRASIPLYSVSLAVKPFGTHPPYQQPGKGMEIVSTKIAGQPGEAAQADGTAGTRRDRRQPLAVGHRPVPHATGDGAHGTGHGLRGVATGSQNARGAARHRCQQAATEDKHRGPVVRAGGRRADRREGKDEDGRAAATPARGRGQLHTAGGRRVRGTERTADPTATGHRQDAGRTRKRAEGSRNERAAARGTGRAGSQSEGRRDLPTADAAHRRGRGDELHPASQHTCRAAVLPAGGLRMDEPTGTLGGRGMSGRRHGPGQDTAGHHADAEPRRRQSHTSK